MTAGAAPGGDETASPAPGTYLDLAADAWAPALQRFACFGSRVLVCDNLAFSADHVIKRKDTVRAKRELPGLLSEIILPLKDQRLAQNQRLLTYRETPLTDEATDHGIMPMYRQDIIGVQAIGHVLNAYEEPPHDWGGKSAWRLFNAATFALAGKVTEKPDLTKQLHQVIDGTCERLH